jgi:hypothetical protein
MIAHNQSTATVIRDSTKWTNRRDFRAQFVPFFGLRMVVALGFLPTLIGTVGVGSKVVSTGPG